MFRYVSLAAFAAIAALAACADNTMSKSAADEAAARAGCRSEAEAAQDRPEGRGTAGADAYAKFVAECMRSKGY